MQSVVLVALEYEGLVRQGTRLLREGKTEAGKALMEEAQVLREGLLLASEEGLSETLASFAQKLIFSR